MKAETEERYAVLEAVIDSQALAGNPIPWDGANGEHAQLVDNLPCSIADPERTENIVFELIGRGVLWVNHSVLAVNIDCAKLWLECRANHPSTDPKERDLALQLAGRLYSMLHGHQPPTVS